ncbi:flagellar FliJ family protein [Limnoglobus roseus]|uniref:Flagellar FliJ protein n=1 Tax=Limnoglobus roseus TaxID=2598579 RepID=A0A5C1A4T6_9BACT|nr:flagellar FliJ family protein [Limnoglobus roseus]QEL13325.1 flagellar export protein FliJ [Limnoglobus roseus]
MKRFEFSMDRVLKVKSQLKRIAEAEEARAEQVFIAARTVVDGVKVQQVRVAEALSGKLGQGVSPCQWVNVFELSENLSRQLAAAEQAASAAEAKWKIAQEERKTVAGEVEALTSLRQQKWDAWKREREAKTQEQLDEISLRRWMAAQEDRNEAARNEAA